MKGSLSIRKRLPGKNILPYSKMIVKTGQGNKGYYLQFIP